MSLKKPKCLTLHEKSVVIKELNKGARVTHLSKKYGVAKSTICKIKRNKQIILKAVARTYLGPGKRKTLKGSEQPRMEKKLYNWFLSQRNENLVVTGEMLKEKAKLLHSEIQETNKKFTASEGWLQRFKTRFGIRLFKISRKKLSTQPEHVDPFKLHLKNKIHELGLTFADEDLYWNILEDPEISEEDKGLPLSILKLRWGHNNAGPESKSLDPLDTSQEVFEESAMLESNRVENEWENEEFKIKVEENEDIQKEVTLESAISGLNVVIQWAESSDIDFTDLAVLKRLREKAVMQKRL